jgi:hypothetical protein
VRQVYHFNESYIAFVRVAYLPFAVREDNSASVQLMPQHGDRKMDRRPLPGFCRTGQLVGDS